MLLLATRLHSLWGIAWRANYGKSANFAMPRIYIVPRLATNAFATGRDPERAAVGVTEGILNLLTMNNFYLI